MLKLVTSNGRLVDGPEAWTVSDWEGLMCGIAFSIAEEGVTDQKVADFIAAYIQRDGETTIPLDAIDNIMDEEFGEIVDGVAIDYSYSRINVALIMCNQHGYRLNGTTLQLAA